MVHKLGYGNWEELKAAFRTSPLFRFDWFVKSRTTQELARRCDTLIRLVEKENQEYDERERQARKEKKLAKVLHIFYLICYQNANCQYIHESHACYDSVILCSISLELYISLVIMFILVGSFIMILILHFQNMTPSKRGGRQPTESPTQMKKRKQLSMDDYVISVCFILKFVNFAVNFVSYSVLSEKVVFVSFCREKRGSDTSNVNYKFWVRSRNCD